MRTACRKQRLVRALKMSPRSKATRDRSEELMGAMLASLAEEARDDGGASERERLGPPEEYAHIRHVKGRAYDDADMAHYRLAGEFLRSLTLEVQEEMDA